MDISTSQTQIDLEEEQLVVISLGEEQYGVSIQAVNTIIRSQEMTHVPQTPDYVLGVINLRGQIVPVIDLRTRFGLPAGASTKDTRIVVVENAGMQIGMLVDTVKETTRIPTNQIEPLTNLGLPIDTIFLRGVVAVEDSLVILLNLDRVLEPLESQKHFAHV